jgi:hypothetical protein
MDVSKCEEGSSDVFLRPSGTATDTRVREKRHQQLDNTAPSRCVAFRLPTLASVRTQHARASSGRPRTLREYPGLAGGCSPRACCRRPAQVPH